MKGSIRKRKKNAWSYRIDLGFVDGKRKQVEKGGFKTEREAVKAMQDALYHLNNSDDQPCARPTAGKLNRIRSLT